MRRLLGPVVQKQGTFNACPTLLDNDILSWVGSASLYLNCGPDEANPNF